ncbi:MAG: type II secretion system F family protein [Acidimicrobiia bacterium]|nr:type II secretion system F family protein [Acidimicrobiia bacterium]
MTLVVAGIAAVATYLLVVGLRPSALADRLAVYLMPDHPGPPEPSRPRRAYPWVPAVLGGGLVGVLGAQGDLFISGAGRSVPALALVGGAGGFVVWSMRRTNLRERRAQRLRYELPIAADALALRIIAGASVASAIDSVCEQMSGVVVDELDDVRRRCDTGMGVEQSLLVASRATLHPDARRLYDLLGHAHTTGGRLATMLSELALDLRAGIERDLTVEGGRRAVVSYGPILALMVPTALLFLLYPTLVGLRSLAGGP